MVKKKIAGIWEKPEKKPENEVVKKYSCTCR